MKPFSLLLLFVGGLVGLYALSFYGTQSYINSDLPETVTRTFEYRNSITNNSCQINCILVAPKDFDYYKSGGFEADKTRFHEKLRDNMMTYGLPTSYHSRSYYLFYCEEGRQDRLSFDEVVYSINDTDTQYGCSSIAGEVFSDYHFTTKHQY